MFSRLSKSIVKSLGHRRYCVGDENLKANFLISTKKTGKNLSSYIKNGAKSETASVDSSKSISVKNVPEKVHPLKNPILSNFPNRSLDLETLMKPREEEKALSLRSGNNEKRKSPKVSDQGSITNSSLFETRADTLVGLFNRLPAIATDWTFLKAKQLRRSEKWLGSPFLMPACDATRVSCSGNCGGRKKGDDPCKKEKAKSQDPCKKEKTKSEDPCKKEKTKSEDPCKKKEKSSKDSEKRKEVNPCGEKALKNPCDKKKDSGDKSKDPCKR